MLVRSRKLGETIEVNGQILSVVDIDRGKVRLGVVAPRGAVLDRQTPYELVISPIAAQAPSPVLPPTSQYHSCFLSYSRRDLDFAKALDTRLRSIGIKIWFDQNEMMGGQKTRDQIDGAIRRADKLLLILSEASMGSQWVQSEIRWARKAEAEQGERKLFPIRLVDYKQVQRWECFDSDSGRDLAVEIREFHIPDFSQWTDECEFGKSIDDLVRDLLR